MRVGGETEVGERLDGNTFSLGCPSQDLKLLSLLEAAEQLEYRSELLHSV